MRPSLVKSATAQTLLWVLLGVVLGGGVLAAVFQSQLAELRSLRSQLSAPAGPDGEQPAVQVKGAAKFDANVKFEAAAQKSVDAVVYISTSSDGGGGNSPDIFSVPQESSGSGVVISPKGFIVTNFHVIENAQQISVTTNDKAVYEAKVLATDPNTDLAVIKIQPRAPLPTLSFANSDKVNIGQWVMAVGNPFNLNSTVTAGIVSAKARSIGILQSKYTIRQEIDYSIESFIQTDAIVNPGNSGGALVNLAGDIIGINTAIVTETGHYAGYSFAIPSNLVRKVVTDLLKFGIVQRGFIGVQIRDISAERAHEEQLPTRLGAYVSDVDKRGAARAAGIQPGDIITHVGDHRIGSVSELQEEIATHRPGDRVSVKVLREGKQVPFHLMLRNLNGDTTLLTEGNAPIKELKKLGVSIFRPSDNILRRLNLEHGVQVAGMEPAGPFAESGVHSGFIITHMDGKRVNTTAEAARHLTAAEGKVRLKGYEPNGDAASFELQLGNPAN